MWDIKEHRKIEVEAMLYFMYYLNHVGYKASRETLDLVKVYSYYLNHVGYKVGKVETTKGKYIGII